MRFSQNLQKAREAAGLSQAELARKVEVPRQHVSKWEGGKNLPSLENALALSRVLGLSVNELFGEEVPKSDVQRLIEALPQRAVNHLKAFLLVLHGETKGPG